MNASGIKIDVAAKAELANHRGEKKPGEISLYSARNKTKKRFSFVSLRVLGG
jgi:hypothetical protein